MIAILCVFGISEIKSELQEELLFQFSHATQSSSTVGQKIQIIVEQARDHTNFIQAQLKLYDFYPSQITAFIKLFNNTNQLDKLKTLDDLAITKKLEALWVKSLHRPDFLDTIINKK